MIDKYLALKTKGLTPTITAFTKTGMGGQEVEWFRLTYSLYDQDTGVLDKELTLESPVDQFVEDGKYIRRRWLAAKEIYEALKTGGFPT